MAQPDKIYLYRITHKNNLDFILKLGKLTCPNHTAFDKNYIGIGDSKLIVNRSLKQINIEPNGNFTDYVSFYFGARSPMLYAIQNGFNGVKKRHPQEIVYIITTFKNIINNKCKYVFTDGHGYNLMSQFFNEEKNLKEVDWNTVNLIRWNDTEDDPDRKRRKQAEFLVFKELPLKAVVALVVYNEAVKNEILTKFARHEFKCKVIVKPNFYY